MPSDTPTAPHPDRKPLTGPPYREFVRLVTQLKGARRYLEVGVNNGSTLALIDCASVGVDPRFVFDRNPTGAKPALHLYQMTSDDYFRDHDPRSVLGGPVEVAFLDGLHLFEFLLRDFINTERVCAADGVILLDDCLPVNIEMTERRHDMATRKDAETAGWWTGDVWKVVHILRAYRPDLTVTPVDVTPTGSIAVTNLDPRSMVLREAYDAIIARYSALEFDAAGFEAHWTTNAPVSIFDAVPRLFPHLRVIAEADV